MFGAKFGQEFGRWAGASGFHGFVASADFFYGLLVVLLLPLEGGGQDLIEGCGGILAVTLGVVDELGLALGGEVEIHGLRVGRCGAEVNLVDGAGGKGCCPGLW